MKLEVLSRNALPAELSIDRVREYCRVYPDQFGNSDHDTQLQLMIDAAVEFVQSYCRQVFRTTQFRQTTELHAFALQRFPVQSIDSAEVYSGDWSATTDFTLVEKEPPLFCFDAAQSYEQYRVTYTAGFDDWPADLTLLVLQIAEENFTNRGATPSTTQGVNLSRVHRLALEQYATHIDALRWG